jgi:hypothetical protein
MMRAGPSLALLALLVQAQPADAVQLDKEECAKLKTEQAQLEHAGVRGTMIKGAEWAKANLPPEKLEQIKRLIELDEQLLFRCGGRPLVVMPSEPDVDPAARGTDPDAPHVEPAVMAPKPAAPAASAPVSAPAVIKPVPPAPKTPAPPPAPAKAPASAARPAPPPIKGAVEGPAAPKPPNDAAPSSKAGTSPEAGASGAATPLSKEEKAAAAKAKAKKKSDDAYRPPSPDWSSNPFGDNPPAKN